MQDSPSAGADNGDNGTSEDPWSVDRDALSNPSFREASQHLEDSLQGGGPQQAQQDDPGGIDRPPHKGRKHHDPDQVTVAVECASQYDFEQSLRAFLAASHDRAHTVYACTFPVSAAFHVDLGPADRGPATSNSYRYGPISTPYTAAAPIQSGHVVRSMSVMEALSYTPDDPKERMRRQRAVARTLKIAVEKVDGHRYAYSNGWLGRESDAFRFSYFCNDSMLNKDRSAAGSNKTKCNNSFPSSVIWVITAHPSTARKRTRKPVYDCQGLIAVKFSTPNKSLEVSYKHIPLHGTYDERAPPPRKNSKRYKILELNDPNK